MASPLALRSPTCLTCLRRITQPPRPAVWTQLRGKKTKSKLIAQLTEDLPGWGPKGNMLRIGRELMRTKWYPSGKMRYVTPDEWRIAKYTEEDLSNRDRSFLMDDGEVAEEEEEFYDPLAEDMARLEAERQQAPQIEIAELEPGRAMDLLSQFVPPTLRFERRLVHPDAPAKTTPEPAAEAAPAAPAPAPEKPAEAVYRSGLAARRARLLEQQQKEATVAARDTETPAQKEEEEEAEAKAAESKETAEAPLAPEQPDAQEQRKIHGSVTTANIAQQIRELVFLDPEAARIQLRPEDIAFVQGTDSENTKVETTGTFEVKIEAHVGKTKLSPIWRTIEVVPATSS